MLEFYNLNGWILFKNIIPKKYTEKLKNISISLTREISEKNLLGTKSPVGPYKFWEGIGCASFFNEELFSFYTSDIMYEVATTLLNSKIIYLYNDQIVYKVPEITSNLQFPEHTDNSLGPNKNNSIHTVNCICVLDTFTENNGPIEVYIKNGYKTILAEEGDILCIRGDTLHRSYPNQSATPRGVYACVYTEYPLEYENYYTMKFPDATTEGLCRRAR
jgi:hypothetical protein